MASIINATTSTGLVSSADNSGSLQLATNNGTTAVTIDTSQNVGVGTTSPNIYGVSGRLLAVSSSTNYSFLALAGSSGNGGAIDFGNQTIRHAEIASLNGSALAFYINGTNSGVGLTEQMRITSAGLLQFNSGYGSVATAYGCRAWVNFNGTGTVAIRGSGNVSSITDNGTGLYTVNFTTAMPDANYAVVMYNNASTGTAQDSFNNNYTGGAGARTTTSVGVSSYTTNFTDSALFDVTIFR